MALRSLLCRAYTLQGLQFLRCGCGISAESAEPILSRQPKPLQSLRLHSVTQAPFAGPAHTSEARYHFSLIRPFVPEPESHHLSPDRHTVRLLPRLSACLLTLRMTERTMLTHRPFRLPASRAVEYTHATMSMHNETSSHAGSEKKDIYNVE